MQRPIASAWVTIAVVVTLIQIGTAAAAFPPVRLSGELGYDFRYERFSSGDNSVGVTEHAGLLRLNAASFLVAPYIALINGGVGINLRRSQVEDGETTTGRFLTGDGTLRLFPRSPFPFTAFFQRLDNSQNADLTDFDTLNTRYGVEQLYRSPRLGSFLFRYEHFELDQDRVSRLASGLPEETRIELIDKSDLFRFGHNKSFGRHSFSTDATANFTTRNQERENSDRIFANVRHRFRPSATLSTENRLLFSDETLGGQRLDLNRRNIELNNYSFWRPRTARRLQVNSLLRARFTSQQNAGQESVEASLFSGNVSANYQWRPRWNLSGNASVNYVDRLDESAERYFVRGRATYTSRSYLWRAFNWQWFAGPEVSHLTDEAGDVQALGLDVGHSLNRIVVFSRRSNLAFDFRQSVTFLEDTEGRSTQRLLHNASVSWQQRLPQRRNLLRFAASDSRTYGGGGRVGIEDNEFQRLSLLASIDQRLTRVSNLRADVNIQTTRSVIAREDEFDDDIDTVGRDLDDGFRPSASVSLSYNHVLLFGVPRLRFRSNLRFLSDSYLPQIDDPRGPNERDEMIWENFLDYAIGRLRARLTASYSEANNATDRMLVLLELRRYFGNF